MGKYRALNSLCQNLVTADKLFQTVVGKRELRNYLGCLMVYCKTKGCLMAMLKISPLPQTSCFTKCYTIVFLINCHSNDFSMTNWFRKWGSEASYQFKWQRKRDIKKQNQISLVPFGKRLVFFALPFAHPCLLRREEAACAVAGRVAPPDAHLSLSWGRKQASWDWEKQDIGGLCTCHCCLCPSYFQKLVFEDKSC